MNRAKLKEKAKTIAYKNKLVLWKPYLIVFFISFIAGFIEGIFDIKLYSWLDIILSLVVTIVTIPITVIVVANSMQVISDKTPDLEKLIKKYYKMIMLIFLVSLIGGVLCGLATLLLIVPGIILSLSYSQSAYILADKADESMSPIDILKKSREMMYGHKMELFTLQLSFIGWLLLGTLTLGILYIWIVPYMQVTYTLYYEELKKISK